MTARALLAAAVLLDPGLAAACAVCLDSAYGNRGFSTAFVGLMLAPFAVVAAFAGILWSFVRGRRRGH
jgi:hypothetical protein